MYPNVLRRYLGTLLDFGAIWLVMFFISRSAYAPQSVSSTLALVGALLFLYEPILTVYFSTLGQTAMGMRVRDEKTLRRITLPQAFNRLLVKYILGWISALTIPAQKRRQAIHDLLTGTIVVEARDATQPPPVAATP